MLRKLGLILFLAVFAILLVAASVAGIRIWLALLISSVISVTVVSGPQLVVSSFVEVFTDPDSVVLIVSVAAIALMAVLYRESGMIDVLSRELTKALGGGWLVVTVVPGVIGLLPVPGGALLSAPIAEHASMNMGMRSEQAAFVNVWYRHILFLFYIISQPLLVASKLSGVPVTDIALAALPVALMMFLIGIPVAGIPVAKPRPQRFDAVLLARSMLPILVSVGSAMMFSFTPLSSFQRLPVLLSVPLGIVVLLLISNAKLGILLEASRDSRIAESTVMTATILMLQHAVRGIVQQGGIAFSGSLYSAVLVALLMSAAAGQPSAGLAIAIPMLNSAQNAYLSAKTVALIYVFSYAGYLASPLHLCYLYTYRYFNVPLSRGYRYMVPALLLSLALSFLMLTAF